MLLKSFLKKMTLKVYGMGADREHSPCGDMGGEHVGVQARAEA